MTPEEIIIDNVENSTSWVLSYDMIYEVIIPCMEEYGKQQWNEAIRKIQYRFETFPDTFSINDILSLLK